MRKLLALVLLAAGCASTPGAPPPSSPAPSTRTVLQGIATRAGKTVVFADDAVATDAWRGREPRGLGWEEAILVVTGAKRLFATRTNDVVLISSEPLQIGTPLSTETAKEPSRKETETKEAPRRGTVTLSVEDAPVAEVIDEISRQAEVPIILRGASDVRLRLSVHEAPWRPLLEWLARYSKLDIRKQRSLIILEPRIQNHIQAEDADAATFYRTLAAQAGKSIVIGPEVRGTVSIDLHNVPYDEALKASAATQGFTVIESK